MSVSTSTVQQNANFHRFLAAEPIEAANEDMDMLMRWLEGDNFQPGEGLEFQDGLLNNAAQVVRLLQLIFPEFL